MRINFHKNEFIAINLYHNATNKWHTFLAALLGPSPSSLNTNPGPKSWPASVAVRLGARRVQKERSFGKKDLKLYQINLQSGLYLLEVSRGRRRRARPTPLTRRGQAIRGSTARPSYAGGIARQGRDRSSGLGLGAIGEAAGAGGAKGE